MVRKMSTSCLFLVVGLVCAMGCTSNAIVMNGAKEGESYIRWDGDLMHCTWDGVDVTCKKVYDSGGDQ